MIALPVLSLLVALAGAQAPAGNPACAVLTPAEAASIIGPGGTTMGVTSAPSGSSCMIQNGDKVITVLQVKSSTADAAAGLWAAKKRIMSGDDLADWPVKAYAGAMKDAGAVGLTKGQNFVEIRVIDAKSPQADMVSRLKTAVKAVAARMP
jgi:shikimate 5-dehydrogenase